MKYIKGKTLVYVGGKTNLDKIKKATKEFVRSAVSEAGTVKKK